MKSIIVLLIVLLSVLIGCNKAIVRPECPDVVKPVVEISDDRSILNVLNLIVDYSLSLESQIKCLKGE